MLFRSNSIKNSFLGSPRFHRRKLQGECVAGHTGWAGLGGLVAGSRPGERGRQGPASEGLPLPLGGLSSRKRWREVPPVSTCPQACPLCVKDPTVQGCLPGGCSLGTPTGSIVPLWHSGLLRPGCLSPTEQSGPVGGRGEEAHRAGAAVGSLPLCAGCRGSTGTFRPPGPTSHPARSTGSAIDPGTAGLVGGQKTVRPGFSTRRQDSSL